MRSTTQALIGATLCLLSPHACTQAAPGPAPAAAVSPQELQRDLEIMKQQLEEMQQKIRKQEELIKQLSTQPTPPPPVAKPSPEVEEQIRQKVRDDIMRELQPSLSATTRTFPSLFNPAIGLVIDTVGSYTRDGGNFELRSAELGLSATVDPFARAYAFINGTQDNVEVEEAAIVTTSLPYNFTVKGGRFFADFGRLAHFHDHELPFVNRPIVIDQYVGGESQADGFEVSWLAPTSQYINLTAGMYNKIGAENERVSNSVPRTLPQFTYLGRAATFVNFGDAHSLDLGATLAYTPQVAVEGGAQRQLWGTDLTYRYLPPGAASYRGLTWGTEVFYNTEKRPFNTVIQDIETGELISQTTLKRRNAFGLYSYVEPRLSRRMSAGFEFEWVESLDPGVVTTTAFTPYITLWASEFQRFRLQYSNIAQPGGHDNAGFLQWTVVLGSHVHGFRDR
jgi:hypothetical protein